MMGHVITMSLEQDANTIYHHTSIDGSSAQRIVDLSSRPLRFCYIVSAADTYVGTSKTMDFVYIDAATHTPFGRGRGYFGYRYIENGSYYCEYLFLQKLCGTVQYSNVPVNIFWNLYMKPSSGFVYPYSVSFDAFSRTAVSLYGSTFSYSLSLRVLTDVQASAVLEWLRRLMSTQSGVVRTVT